MRKGCYKRSNQVIGLNRERKDLTNERILQKLREYLLS